MFSVSSSIDRIWTAAVSTCVEITTRQQGLAILSASRAAFVAAPSSIPFDLNCCNSATYGIHLFPVTEPHVKHRTGMSDMRVLNCVMQTIIDALCTVFAIPNSEPAVIVCPDGRQIVLCDAGSAAWYDERLPVVSVRNPGLGNLPVHLLIDARHADCLTLSFKDAPDVLIAQYLQQATEFFNRYDKVLVHCRMGRSRSAAIVVGYLIRHYGFSFARALDLVRGSRPSVNINEGFVQQLREQEQ